jgi:SAM-dependent methyltransferase
MIAAYHPGTRWRLRVVERLLPLGPQDSVLDAGCADGFIAEALAARAGRVVGVDIDSAVVAHNGRRPLPANLSFVTADLNELDQCFPPASFTHVVCLDVLEHASSFAGIVRQFARVLQAGGRFVATVPLGDHGHFGHSPAQAQAVLQAAGFDVERCATMALPPLTLLACRAVHAASRRVMGGATEVDCWSETRSFRLSQRPSLPLRLYRYAVFPWLLRLMELEGTPWRPGEAYLLIVARRPAVPLARAPELAVPTP